MPLATLPHAILRDSVLHWTPTDANSTKDAITEEHVQEQTLGRLVGMKSIPITTIKIIDKEGEWKEGKCLLYLL